MKKLLALVLCVAAFGQFLVVLGMVARLDFSTADVVQDKSKLVVSEPVVQLVEPEVPGEGGFSAVFMVEDGVAQVVGVVTDSASYPWVLQESKPPAPDCRTLVPPSKSLGDPHGIDLVIHLSPDVECEIVPDGWAASSCDDNEPSTCLYLATVQ